MIVEDIIKELDGGVNVKIETMFESGKIVTYYNGLAHDVPYRNIHLNVLFLDIKQNTLIIRVD